MKIPPAELGYIEETFKDAAAIVVEAYEDVGPATAVPESSPALLAEAMLQLIDVLKRIESESESMVGVAGGAGAYPGADTTEYEADLSELGEYGIQLLSGMAEAALELKLDQHRRELEGLSFPLALWIARRGGELVRLECVVNAVAWLANQITDPVILEDLCVEIGEILDAVAPDIRQDLDNSDPGRPWRILNLNRGIVATRTRNPAIMADVFESLIENIPQDVPDFFREGMEQMDAVGYPKQVRDVMTRYYKAWCVNHTLH